MNGLVSESERRSLPKASCVLSATLPGVPSPNAVSDVTGRP
ncbi:hypothetical protein EES43_02905 [Streptomyces sp. ADI96-02]|nr:hypothetical protein EES43_02905 [Streptomyces sp. ADI96-02]